MTPLILLLLGSLGIAGAVLAASSSGKKKGDIPPFHDLDQSPPGSSGEVAQPAVTTPAQASIPQPQTVAPTPSGSSLPPFHMLDSADSSSRPATAATAAAPTPGASTAPTSQAAAQQPLSAEKAVETAPGLQQPTTLPVEEPIGGAPAEQAEPNKIRPTKLPQDIDDIISRSSPHAHHRRALKNAEALLKKNKTEEAEAILERIKNRINDPEIKDKISNNLEQIRSGVAQESAAATTAGAAVGSKGKGESLAPDAVMDAMMKLTEGLKDVASNLASQLNQAQPRSPETGQPPQPETELPPFDENLLPEFKDKWEKYRDLPPEDRRSGQDRRDRQQSEGDSLGDRRDRSDRRQNDLLKERDEFLEEMRKKQAEREQEIRDALNEKIKTPGAQTSGDGRDAAKREERPEQKPPPPSLPEAIKTPEKKLPEPEKPFLPDATAKVKDDEVPKERTPQTTDQTGEEASDESGKEAAEKPQEKGAPSTGESGGYGGGGGSGGSGGPGGGGGGGGATEEDSGSGEGVGSSTAPDMAQAPLSSAAAPASAISPMFAGEEMEDYEGLPPIADSDFSEESEKSDQPAPPPQEIRGVLELKPPEEDDAPYLTLTYDFSRLPHSFELSSDYNTMEFAYYKYKPMLIKAQELTRRKMLKKALNYYRVIKSQKIPPELHRMINRNIQDITEYLEKFLMGRS